MKIQINSKEALERLIGDDKEMEIAIKKAIINQFATQYLKSVANSEIMNSLKKAVTEEVDKEVERYIEKVPGWISHSFKAKPELQVVINKTIDESLSEMVKAQVKEEIANIDKEVKQHLGYQLDVICDKITKENIDRLVKFKLQKMIEQ